MYIIVKSLSQPLDILLRTLACRPAYRGARPCWHNGRRWRRRSWEWGDSRRSRGGSRGAGSTAAAGVSMSRVWATRNSRTALRVREARQTNVSACVSGIEAPRPSPLSPARLRKLGLAQVSCFSFAFFPERTEISETCTYKRKCIHIFNFLPKIKVGRPPYLALWGASPLRVLSWLLR